MTSAAMRGNNLFRRNEFHTTGKWQIPVIEYQEIELENIELISYSDIRSNDSLRNCQKGVHFFIDDYRFEGIYRNPEQSIGRLSQYRFLLSPDYSTYSDMNYWRQIESIAHSRWVGAYWQDQGLIVIPTVSWSDEGSYCFCFDGLPRRGIVAVGMIGCKQSKETFLSGYNAMLNHIDPKAIICYGDPFDEMEGTIIPINYLDSRKVVR